MAALAANHVRRFDLEPKIAFLSHSDFGSYDTESARKMRRATALLKRIIRSSRPTARCRAIPRCRRSTRKLVLPDSGLQGEANILMMPTLDAANIAYQMVKVLTDAIPVGPILIGPARPAHILTPSVTARGILNMTAVAAVEAQERAGGSSQACSHDACRGAGSSTDLSRIV